MSEFSAHSARLTASKVYDIEYDKIKDEIIAAASIGKYKLHVYRSLNKLTKDRLKEAGFMIYIHPSMDIQRDKLYYTISWNN